MYVRQGEKLYLSPEMTRWPRTSSGKPWSPMSARGWCGSIWTPCCRNAGRRWTSSNAATSSPAPTSAACRRRGTVRRTSVSNMEIWCECFGKERANLRRTDSNELTGILARLGWKRADNKVRIPLYGPQYIFVPKGCSK